MVVFISILLLIAKEKYVSAMDRRKEEEAMEEEGRRRNEFQQWRRKEKECFSSLPLTCHSRDDKSVKKKTVVQKKGLFCTFLNS